MSSQTDEAIEMLGKYIFKQTEALIALSSTLIRVRNNCGDVLLVCEIDKALAKFKEMFKESEDV